MVYASSSSVYGSNEKVPYSVDDKVDNPISLYAATKKSNELLAHAYSKLYNIPSTGLRFFTVYGPAGRPDMAYFGFTNKLRAGHNIQIFNYGNCKSELDELADKVVYTGPIDAYFDYKLGTLEYRSVRFENELLDKPSFQGNAAVNYTDRETPWTRIIEHKWFEFGKDENGNDLPKTIISREYSSEWKPGDEPYYPVNDAKNSLLYSEYKKLADAESKVIFGGRLGEYKYYDMDQVIAAVLNKCESEFGEK